VKLLVGGKVDMEEGVKKGWKWVEVLCTRSIMSYSNKNFSFKWELLACLFPSTKKRGAIERGWVQNRPFSFEWKACIWIGGYTVHYIRKVFLEAQRTLLLRLCWIALLFVKDKILKQRNWVSFLWQNRHFSQSFFWAHGAASTRQ